MRLRYIQRYQKSQLGQPRILGEGEVNFPLQQLFGAFHFLDTENKTWIVHLVKLKSKEDIRPGF